MHELIISGIECYAHHGCLEEETKIGCRYVIDITFCADLTAAVESDELDKTIDYVVVNELVKGEMLIPSNLIEHVAWRIHQKLNDQFPSCEKIKVNITKFQPPVQGYIHKATFSISS
jgi:dihydroneopterin aldolase